MAQRLLHHQQPGAPGLGEHHAVRVQAGGGQGGGEQIMPHHRPQHRPAALGQQPGQQQRRGRPVLDIRPVPCHLVQRPSRQSAARQVLIDRRHTEAQHAGTPG